MSKGKKRCGWLLSGGRGRCTKLVPDGKHIYCEEHQQEYIEGYRRRTSAKRADGNLYSTQRWKRLRRAHLYENPLCEVCGRPGNVADHVLPHRGNIDRFYNSHNLWTLCKTHHDQVTQFEMQWRKAGASDQDIWRNKIDWAKEL